MSSAYPYVHIYTDSMGETHMERKVFTLEQIDFSPPTPFLDISPPDALQSLSVLRLPAGWAGTEWHPSPCRQWQVYLKGEIYFEVSDGSNCTVAAGETILLEDTTGKGHLSHAMHGKEVFLLSLKRTD